MDLAKFDVVEGSNVGAKVYFKHPGTNAPLKIFAVVCGRDSDVYREAMAVYNRETLERASAAASTGQSPEVQTPQQRDTIAIGILAKCTKGWGDEEEGATTDKLTDGTQSYEFSEKNAVLLYTKFPWMKEQVDAWMNNRALFIKG